MPRRSAASAGFSTSVDRLEPPADLTGPERALFVDLTLSCEPSHFQRSDLSVLCAYCRAVCLEQTASSELAAAGYVGADGKASGWLAILTQAQRGVSTFSRLLKLNPVARVPLPAKMEPGSTSYYSRLAMEQQKHDEPN